MRFGLGSIIELDSGFPIENLVKSVIVNALGADLDSARVAKEFLEFRVSRTHRRRREDLDLLFLFEVDRESRNRRKILDVPVGDAENSVASGLRALKLNAVRFCTFRWLVC